MYDKNNTHQKTNWPIKILFFGLIATGFVLLLGGVVMWLWNLLLPKLIDAKPISFWEAVGLFVLCRILFGGLKSGMHHRHRRSLDREHKKQMWKERWMNMNEEERAAFKAKWENYCNKNK